MLAEARSEAADPVRYLVKMYMFVCAVALNNKHFLFLAKSNAATQENENLPPIVKGKRFCKVKHCTYNCTCIVSLYRSIVSADSIRDKVVAYHTETLFRFSLPQGSEGRV